MITAIDTNVLLDYLNPTELQGEESLERLLAAGQDGPLVISSMTYAELAAEFESLDDLDLFVETAGLNVVDSSTSALYLAGRAFKAYAQRRPSGFQCRACGTLREVTCEQCGESIRARQHILADFIIGAHALTHADRLLTRDRSYYRTYFPDLTLA